METANKGTPSKKKNRSKGEWCFSQRKDKIWTARKQFGLKADGGKNIKAFYGKTITEVKSKAKEYEILIHSNPIENSKVTFEEYFKNWMLLYKYNKVKPSTYDTIDFCFECRIKSYTELSQAQIHQITTSLLQKYFNNLASSNDYSYATIKKTKNIINNCLNKAVTIRELQYNPMNGVELVPEDLLMKKTKTIEFFDDEDIKILIWESKRQTEVNRKPEDEGGYKTSKYYKATPTDYYRYSHNVILMLQTGIRIGEALALKWCNVDLINKRISIESNITSSYDRDDKGERIRATLKEGTTKTKKGIRFVPLSDVAIEALCKIKKKNEKHILGNDFVFLTKNGTNPTPKSIRTTLNTMQINANTKVQDSGLHVLRHTFASMLIRRGVNIKIVSELLGHKKISTTYDIYVSIIDEQKYDAVNVLNLMNNQQNEKLDESKQPSKS